MSRCRRPRRAIRPISRFSQSGHDRRGAFVVDVFQRALHISGKVQPGPGNPTQHDDAVLIGDECHGVDHLGGRLRPEAPHQHGSRLDPAQASERTGRRHSDRVVQIAEQIDQHRNNLCIRARAACRVGTHRRIRVSQQRQCRRGGQAASQAGGGVDRGGEAGSLTT
jgi:hypothetical protein